MISFFKFDLHKFTLNMDSLDALLTELQNKYVNGGDRSDQDLPPKQSVKSVNSQEISCPSSKLQELMGLDVETNSLDLLLDDLRQGQSSQPTHPYRSQDGHLAAPISVPVPDPSAIAIGRDLQEIAETHREQARQQIVKQATVWLEALDPLSGEGLWFEAFAKSYSSRLEAAIALLETEQHP
jgi:hypothetical protein